MRFEGVVVDGVCAVTGMRAAAPCGNALLFLKISRGKKDAAHAGPWSLRFEHSKTARLAQRRSPPTGRTHHNHRPRRLLVTRKSLATAALNAVKTPVIDRRPVYIAIVVYFTHACHSRRRTASRRRSTFPLHTTILLATPLSITAQRGTCPTTPRYGFVCSHASHLDWEKAKPCC